MSDITHRISIKASKFFGIEAPFSDLNSVINNGIVSSKMYDKRCYFNFEIVNFLFVNCTTVDQSSDLMITVA